MDSHAVPEELLKPFFPYFAGYLYMAEKENPNNKKYLWKGNICSINRK